MNCQKCGNQLNEGASFCPYCGNKASFSMISNNAIDKSHHKKSKKVLVPIIFVIIAVMVIILAALIHIVHGPENTVRERLIGSWYGYYKGTIYENDTENIEAERTISFEKDGTASVELSQTNKGNVAMYEFYQPETGGLGIKESSVGHYSLSVDSNSANEIHGHILYSGKDDINKIYYANHLQFYYVYHKDTGILELKSNGGDCYTTHFIEYTKK